MTKNREAKQVEDRDKALMVRVHEKLDDKRDEILEGIKLIPEVGGLIAFIISKYVPESRRTRLLTFVDQLKDALEFLRGDVSVDKADTEEFRYVVDEVFIAVIQSTTDAKLGYYKDILQNTLFNPDATSVDEKQIYLQLVRDLSPAHLQVVGAFYAHQDDGLVGDHDVVRDLLRNLSDDQLRFIVRDLESRDLLNTSERWATLGGGLPKWSKPSSEPALPPVITLTPFCKGFLEFIIYHKET